MSRFLPENLEALVLAGGVLEESLKPLEDVPSKALLTFGKGKTQLERVGSALQSLGLKRVAVVAGEAVRRAGVPLEGVVWLEEQSGLMENLIYGLENLSTEWVLVCSVDLPFLTTGVLKKYLEECSSFEADVYVPVLSQQVIEAAYPGAKRTYGTLVDGRLTSGNVFLVHRGGMLSQKALLRDLLALRKKPLRLALRIGVMVLIKAIFKRLRVADVEAVAARLTGATVQAVFTSEAALGMDVDKPADYELVKAKLGE